MKKMILTFCASILLLTAAPIGQAAYTSDKEAVNSVKTYKVKQPNVTTYKKQAPTAQQAMKPSTASTNNQIETTTNSNVSAIEQAVVDETNKARATNGLAPLQIDTALMAAAREKSTDMQVNQYFSHTSPTFGSPFDRLKALNISYRSAGENIAKGQRSAKEVVDAWMNSTGHRANILNERYTHIGVGFVQDGYVWTQQFIQK